ncbi:MAG TPA: ribosome silencing factor [Pseudolabrys sp.]|nr:ribosome silencing factor [Pseudolabrys sp.]
MDNRIKHRKDRYLAKKKTTRSKPGTKGAGIKKGAQKANKKKSGAKKPAPKTPGTKQVHVPAAAKPAAENKALTSILASLNEMKAEDVVTIDLSDKSSIGETMVVTTGRSNVHVASIADRVVRDLKMIGITGVGVEGLRQGDWVLIDTGGVILHIFRPEVRAFYAIEKMWSA